MKYGYKLGETVTYRTCKVKDVTCSCCGNIETEYKDIKRKGRITDRCKDYSISSGTNVQMVEQRQPDGTTLIISTPAEIAPPVTENFYTINGETIIEDAIEKITDK